MVPNQVINQLDALTVDKEIFRKGLQASAIASSMLGVHLGVEFNGDNRYASSFDFLQELHFQMHAPLH